MMQHTLTHTNPSGSPVEIGNRLNTEWMTLATLGAFLAANDFDSFVGGAHRPDTPSQHPCGN